MLMKKGSLVVCFCLSCTGCIAGNELQYDVVETSIDQNIAELELVPTVFEMPVEKVSLAWERANFFFMLYLPNEQLDVKTEDVLSNRYSQGKYIYVIKKELQSNGQSAFKVRCWPNGGDATIERAELNAKNVANFIRSGKLELMALYQ